MVVRFAFQSLTTMLILYQDKLKSGKKPEASIYSLRIAKGVRVEGFVPDIKIPATLRRIVHILVFQIA